MISEGSSKQEVNPIYNTSKGVKPTQINIQGDEELPNTGKTKATHRSEKMSTILGFGK